MAEYKVIMLKRAQRLALSPAELQSNVIAMGNNMSPRRIKDIPLAEYRALQREYDRETSPWYYRLAEAGPTRWGVWHCDCDCICFDCGLELKCGLCECEESRLIASIPRELTGGHLIEAGNDAMRLTESLVGKNCDEMSIRDFRTVQYAVMLQMETGEIPL